MTDENQTKKIEDMAKWLRQDAAQVAFIVGMISAGDPFYRDNPDCARRKMRDSLESVRKLADFIEKELGNE